VEIPSFVGQGCPIAACVVDIPGTRSGRREGIAVDRVLGQILRKAAWDRLEVLDDELASNADNLVCAQRRIWGGLRRLSSGLERPGLICTPQG
jgi:hypothetical protein